jgi:hypothetical protein
MGDDFAAGGADDLLAVQTQSPRLWLNPWAGRPLELESDWLAPTPISPDGQLTFGAAPLAADAIFALPAAWPGPEKPSPSCEPSTTKCRLRPRNR